MPSQYFEIQLGGSGSPADQYCNNNDTIAWCNSTPLPITLTLPACVGGGQVTIQGNAKTRPYGVTITGTTVPSNCTYSYLATGGTIYGVSGPWVTLPGSPPPVQIQTEPGDKVGWTNKTGHSVQVFALPECVPPKPAVTVPMLNGTSTGLYTINANSHGPYTYTYELGADGGPASGIIDVGN